MDQLKKMSEELTHIERYNLIQSFSGCKMSEGSSVSSHMLKLMRYTEQLEKLFSPRQRVGYGGHSQLSSVPLLGIHHELPHAWGGEEFGRIA